MRITAWSVEPSAFDNLDPDWRYGTTHVPRLEGVFVALRAEDGTVGEGYSPVLGHLGLDRDGLAAACGRIASLCLGGDASAYRVTATQAARQSGLSGPALAAVDMALVDLAARIHGLSVSVLLGGRFRDRVPVVRIVPIKAPEAMADAARALVDDGYRAVKLKATGTLDEDVARVSAVRAAVGAAVEIYVDPNQAYALDGAIRFCEAAAELGVARVEQPVPATDRDMMARLVAAVRLPVVEADEKLFELPDLVDVLERRAAHGICLKFARSGGILPTLAMAELAHAHGVAVRMGTAFGGPLISLAGAQVAAALANADGFAEVAEFAHFSDATHAPPRIEGGCLVLDDTPGFGQVRQAPWQADWLSA